MGLFALNFKGILSLTLLTILLVGFWAPFARFGVFADGDWADPNCRHRMKLAFKNSASSENLTDFPVLVVLNSSRINYGETSATDIRFYDGTTLLPKETELWNASGNSYVWVKVSEIDNSDADYIYAYYNCTGPANLDDPASVWSDYAMVQHLEESSGSLTDSSSNHNNGTPYGGVAQTYPGKIDGAESYDGTDDYSIINNSASLNFGTSSFSFTFWFRSRSTATQDILDKKGGAAGDINAGYKLVISTTSSLGYSVALGDGVHNVRLNSGSQSSWGTDVWTVLTAIVNRTEQIMYVYLDGVPVNSTSINTVGSVDSIQDLSLGRQAGGTTRYFNGALDEVCIMNGARSASWVKAQYLSTSDQYITYGVEEPVNHPPEKPFDPIPSNGATGVTTSPTLSVNVVDPDGDKMDVYFYQPCPVNPPADNFTLVALPDTQIYSESYPNIFDNQTQWIASTAGNLKTVFVTHEGDVVNQNTQTIQWQRANNSMSKLDGNVPWAIAPGNHELDSNTTNYNLYFGFDRFNGQTWYGGAYQNTNTNSYELFTGGDDDYLIFHLQYGVNDSVLAWANATIASYPNRRVIVTTHDYMDSSGTRSTTGTLIWNDFVAPHADQIFLVMCGHTLGEAKRTDVVNGHPVYQLLADFQGRTNGGNGWLRTLEFHPVEDKIYVKTYSPYLANFETDSDSQFTLDYNMTHQANSPPLLIGVDTTVSSGGIASIAWNGLNASTTYQWYTVAVDAFAASNQSDTWGFTTGTGQCAVYVEPTLIEKTLSDVGSTFRVNISIQNVVDLFGFDLNITWDGDLVTLAGVEYQNELNNMWSYGNWVAVKNDTGFGWYKLVATSTLAGFNGAQPMAVLTFRVEYSGSIKGTLIHFDTHKLSNSHYAAILHVASDGSYTIQGATPKLDMDPTAKTCRVYNETFSVKVNLTTAIVVDDFAFEIHYNTTLLDYVTITWDAWESGTINADEGNGVLTGSTSGGGLNGTRTLITIEFKASFYHVWKSSPNWTNDITDTIFIQKADLSFPSAPDLRYEKGGITQIDVGPDFAYTFSPIPGDVNNDGTVDIVDLQKAAAYFGVKQGDPGWSGGSTYDLDDNGMIEVFDLRTIAANYGYIY
jgi:Domain of unknown function (DUF2341)/Calcineurin-like phosphoesterase